MGQDHTRADIRHGQAAGFPPGAPAAYWIWQGLRGGWRSRTKTEKMPRLLLFVGKGEMDPPSSFFIVWPKGAIPTQVH